MKVLIIRLSSFGDILQAQPCIAAIHKAFPGSQIDWFIRKDLEDLLKNQPLHRIFSLDRKKGIWGLFHSLWQLSGQNYSHIYDAHNNLRSALVRFFVPLLTFLRFGKYPRVVVRSKNRWRRFLFFRCHRPVFQMPFRGSQSFLDPLAPWGVSPLFLQQPHWQCSEPLPMPLPSTVIALAPSAAWPNKRWPVEFWKELITLLPHRSFVLLGGPQDTFCEDIANVAPLRTLNLAGRLSLRQSGSVVKQALLTVSADTGLLHAADQLRVPNIGLIGPTAFGYTSQNTSVILETQLDCKPCSKDGSRRCTNSVWQKCMRDIRPELVAKTVETLLGSS